MAVETLTEYKIRGIPSNLIDRFWPFALPYVKRALDHTCGELSPDDLKKSCLNKDVQLWLVFHEDRIVAAITTEIICYPQRKHLRIITVAGSDFDSWVDLMYSTIAKGAHELKCDGVEAFVRKGYVPKLLQYGFKHKYSVMVAEV